MNNHDILLPKPEYYYGIRGVPLNLLKISLDWLSQYIRLINFTQETIYGVPQQSVLGPILSLSYLCNWLQELIAEVSWFLPPPPSHPPIIMGGLNLKIFQNFVGTKIFLGFAGEKTSMGGVKIVSGE